MGNYLCEPCQLTCRLSRHGWAGARFVCLLLLSRYSPVTHIEDSVNSVIGVLLDVREYLIEKKNAPGLSVVAAVCGSLQ